MQNDLLPVQLGDSITLYFRQVGKVVKTPVQLEPFSKNGILRLLARPHPVELARGIGFALWGVTLGAFAVATAFSLENSGFMGSLKTLLCIGAGAMAVDALSTGLRYISHYRHTVLMVTDRDIATVSGAAGIVRAYPRSYCHIHEIRHSWLGNQLNYGLIRIDDPTGHHLVGLLVHNPGNAIRAASSGDRQPAEAVL